MILPCGCRTCRGCALKREADFRRSSSSSSDKKKAGKKSEPANDDVHVPVPCAGCNARCKVPARGLPFDHELVKELPGDEKEQRAALGQSKAGKPFLPRAHQRPLDAVR